ncbi:MAG TPA: type II CAAX endopeptidase family protein [Candidatus Limnocylindrales bacterium]|nr:type II CAAX endopeptidase family protein [Candidatus Limnocylindrales bacterium]
MTDPSGPSDPSGSAPSGSPPASPPPVPSPLVPPPTSAGRIGARYFTIEGRAAPALFVLGWLGSVVGLGMTAIGFAAGATGAALVVLAVGLIVLSIGLVSAAGSQAIERRAAGFHAYAGPSPLLVFAASIPVVYLLLLAVGTPLAALGLEPARPVVELLLVAIQVLVYAGLVALLVVGTGALSWREMGWGAGARAAVADLAWGAVFAGPVIGVTIVVSGVLVVLFQVVPESPLPPTGDASGLLLHLVAGAILAPIGEEVLFRGVAVTAWTRTFGAQGAIVRSAIFFALVHVLLLGGSSVGEAAGLAVVGFASRLPVALVLAWVYLRRRSIYAAIGLHSAFNAVLLIVSELGAGAIEGAG